MKLRCKIDVRGLAEWCEVASETPAGKGFGAAALELRTTFKLTTASESDGPVSIKTLSIRFRAPNRDFDVAAGTFHGNPMAVRAIIMLNHPRFSEAPNFDNVVHAYPVQAGDLKGYAVAHCQVLSTGELKMCGIVKEVPDRRGFGKAALSIVHKFCVAPQWATAPHSKPLWTDIPIRFEPPNEAVERRVTAPKWLAGWDPKSQPSVFPPEAVAKGVITGRGVAECVVGSDGGMNGCTAQPGDPDGQGFSEAAAKFAALLKINLWSADAGPVEGGKLRIAIRLNLPPAK